MPSGLSRSFIPAWIAECPGSHTLHDVSLIVLLVKGARFGVYVIFLLRRQETQRRFGKVVQEVGQHAVGCDYDVCHFYTCKHGQSFSERSRAKIFVLPILR